MGVHASVPIPATEPARNPTASAPRFARLVTGVAVIGAGQAGLSSAYHLKQADLEPMKDFLVLDRSPRPGGAWQHRWPSLTLSTVNRIHDLPGMPFEPGSGNETEPAGQLEPARVEARVAVPEYFARYEETFELPVIRPVTVEGVRERDDGRFVIGTDRFEIVARGLINATGTWETPRIPDYPSRERFGGRQLHTKDYRSAEEFGGQHVVIVGAGISAIQHLDEISRVTSTTWVTRREPDFREGPFGDQAGREAVAQVEQRVRQGLLPESVVSVTGLPVTERIRDMRDRGVLQRRPMFSEITEDGVRWADGTEVKADVILWATGFESNLGHLEPLGLREANGGIVMGGRLATQVEREPRVHLVGYGPSASTIGANRAGRAAALELIRELGLR